MINDLINKCYLLLIQRFIIDKGRECFHGSIMIQFGYLPDHKPKGCVPILTFVVFFTTELLGQDT